MSNVEEHEGHYLALVELVGVYDLRHIYGCPFVLPALYIRLMRNVEEHEGHYLSSKSIKAIT